MTDHNFLVPQTKTESTPAKKLPCPFSPAGMLQPSHLQPPPMFGPRGSTIPPKHLAPYAHFKVNRPQPQPSRSNDHNKNINQQHRARDSVPRYHNKFNSKDHTRRPQQHQKSREFWCEPCDRYFRSADLLLEHNSQHRKCGIDGCKFEGHEMIVNKHIQMQHSTGLYERLKNLDTPDDILKWREERKKRYPTKANIELRQQLQDERNKRGEKLTNSKGRFGHDSDRRRCNNNSSDRNHEATKNKEKKPDKNKDGKRKRRRLNKKIEATVTQRDDDDDRKESGLPMFRGTSQLEKYKKRKEMEPKNALSTLLGMYESDSNSNESFSDGTASADEMGSEGTETTSSQLSVISSCSMKVEVQDTALESDTLSEERLEKIENICESLLTENSGANVLAGNDTDELPSEERIVKMEIPDLIPSGVTAKANNSQKAKVLDKRMSKRPTVMDLSKKYRNQNTMLEKLLQNEIRHERNVLLQCVRHVVKENFFGIGQKSASI